MADDAQTIRNINWRELFPFTHLFRAFRIAVHPSKLFLGFALLFLLYCGGRVLDGLWPVSHYATTDEIDSYSSYRWNHQQDASFEDRRQEDRGRNVQTYARYLREFGIVTDPSAALASAYRHEHASELYKRVVAQRNESLAKAKAQHDDSLKAAAALGNDDTRREARRTADDVYDANMRSAEVTAQELLHKIRACSPRPIFDTFFEYESRQFHNVVDNALSWNWLNGMVEGGGGGHSPTVAGRQQPGIIDPNFGVVRSIANLAAVGPGWLIRYHFCYFVLYAAWFLVIWAVFGGAISRIAAVHVARDEKISVRQALRFSFSKLLSFVFAPLIPLIIVLVLGFIVALGGLLMYIPVIGPIIVGAVYILALLAGLVMTLVATGTAGGFNLMYPTIAVEGSDSFDAISRSFSYVFAKPWRMLFYTALSLVYGALCFLFARYFVYVMLGLTHYFTQWFLLGQPNRYWPQIWPPVSDFDLAYRVNWHGLAWSEAICAFFIMMWVYVALTFLGAFVISFYFSANTIIYYLMRREVDATELDDVYVEETEDDFTDPVSAPATTTATITAAGITDAPATGGTGAGSTFPSEPGGTNP